MLLLAGLLAVTTGYAQKKNFSYKFYGQVRGDLFYNSRANSEIVDGLFHLYPKDVDLDADGELIPALCAGGDRCGRAECGESEDNGQAGSGLSGLG